MLAIYALRILPEMSGNSPKERRMVEPEDYLDNFTAEEFEAIADPTLRALPLYDNPFIALAIFEGYRNVNSCYRAKREPQVYPLPPSSP